MQSPFLLHVDWRGYHQEFTVDPFDGEFEKRSAGLGILELRDLIGVAEPDIIDDRIGIGLRCESQISYLKALQTVQFAARFP